LRSVLGVWIWAALVNRPLLLIPSAVFSLIAQHEGRVLRWWPSVRREVVMMKQMIPFLTARLNRQMAPYVFATDAEGVNETDLGGFGVVGARVPTAVSEEALLAGPAAGRTITKLNGDIAKLRDGSRELRRCFGVSRVPRQLLDSSEYAWDILAHGRWRRSEHITLGEGRGALHLLEGLARDPSAHGFVVLSLMDNEPWAHASSKGRSPTFRLNRLLQRKASLTAITDIEFLQPWVDTAHQHADGASRLRCPPFTGSSRAPDSSRRTPRSKFKSLL
jgi:hypothetical protein